jgi:stearoyl-CoA desaturase (Delta-9 desaturase)
MMLLEDLSMRASSVCYFSNMFVFRFYLSRLSRLTTVLWQFTSSVNSLAHYMGEKTYDDRKTLVDSFWVALVTFGEGYHNFHHQYPMDYRNGYKSYNWDPAKWFIWSMEKLGLATQLKACL